MSPFVQTLESRTLLSASGATIVTDEGRLLGDARSIRADVHHFGSVLKNDSRLIQTDLRGLPGTPANRTLVSTLRADVQKGVAKLQKDVAAVVRVGSADARRAIADGLAVFLNPTNARALARLAGDITRLTTEVATPVATVLADAASFQSTVNHDLTAVAAANPTNTALQSHVQTATGDTSLALTTAQNDLQTVQTDVGTLLHDLT